MEGSIFSTLTSNELGIFFTGLGVALSAILSGIGSAIGVGKAGQAAAGVIADQPERFGNCLVLGAAARFSGHIRFRRIHTYTHILRPSRRQHRINNLQPRPCVLRGQLAGGLRRSAFRHTSG